MSLAPTSKVQAGGAGAVLAGIIITVAAQVGYPLPEWAVGVLPVVLSLALAYFVPHSMQDKINMVTEQVIAAAVVAGKVDPPKVIVPVPVPGAGGPVNHS